jgi:hypothetical protein
MADWPYKEVGFFPWGPSSLGASKAIEGPPMTCFFFGRSFWGPLEKKMITKRILKYSQKVF